MQVKFIISCKACGCNMEIEASRYKNTGKITCQNCGQALEGDNLALFDNAVKALQALPAETAEDGAWVPEDRGFYFSLDL